MAVQKAGIESGQCDKLQSAMISEGLLFLDLKGNLTPIFLNKSSFVSEEDHGVQIVLWTTILLSGDTHDMAASFFKVLPFLQQPFAVKPSSMMALHQHFHALVFPYHQIYLCWIIDSHSQFGIFQST